MTKPVHDIDGRVELLSHQSTVIANFSSIVDYSTNVWAFQFANSTGNGIDTSPEYRNTLPLAATLRDQAAKAGQNHSPQARNDTSGKDLIIEQSASDAGDAQAKGNVLANDRDADKNDHLSVFQAKIVKGEFGTLNLASNGTWTYTLNDKDLDTQALGDGEKGIEHFKYTAIDTHGAKDSAVLKITVLGRDDVVTPLTIDTIAGDDVVNVAEADGNVTITGMAGSAARNGDTVTLSVGGASFKGTVAAGHFSINVLGSALATDTDSTIALAITRKGVSHPIAEGTHHYGVDTTPPVATVTFDNVTADNAINLAESLQALINITGMAGGDVKAGESVTLTVNGHAVTGTFAADKTFSIGVSGADLAVDSDHTIDASVTTTDAAGNSSTATLIEGFSVDIMPPSEDFDGDFHSDVLFFKSIGSVAMWQMDGEKIKANVTVGSSVSSTWHLRATEDFGGDHLADILFQSDGGSVALWKMNGSTVVSNATVSTISSDWHFQTADDFNGDDRADILWRNDAGKVAMWEMDGAKIIGNLTVSSIGGDWHLAGADDFNGDHKSDILWASNSGSVAMWQMNGEKITSNTTVGKLDSGSSVVAVDDFSGDGKADILIRSSAGAINLWRMNGDKIVATESVASIGSDWALADTGDYNGDGYADILWRSTSGKIAMWEMNGAHLDANLSVSSVGSEWIII